MISYMERFEDKLLERKLRGDIIENFKLSFLV